ncbi:hypothetical protein H5410_036560 [Solanum commersonii]|uniref:Uncharacterized protein n=1 Tax=Solanum commersonii TaxID=4109 RepID=A0A9J5Y6X7_SOLCO|nr:hypothetical protein H5410_036560 [Solanum commersonii]
MSKYFASCASLNITRVNLQELIITGGKCPPLRSCKEYLKQSQSFSCGNYERGRMSEDIEKM